MSYQTGTNGEIVLVLGAKDIGKTFGLRLKCVQRFIKFKEIFCEICRTATERDEIMRGYFDKLQIEGFFTDYDFKIEKACGYIAKKCEDSKQRRWELICYFVALTNFQREKKRTFMPPKRFIYDEAIIDTKDKYHRYLKDEFLILANILDSVSRQHPGSDVRYYVYLLGNAVDLTCPLLKYLGINKIPAFGYNYYKNKTVLLHYVKPWDAEIRRKETLVGRMLEGMREGDVIFDNVFLDITGKELSNKSPGAAFKFAIVWEGFKFGVWADHKKGLWFINSKVPTDAKNIYTLIKKDSSVDYQAVARNAPLMDLLKNLYFEGCLRYETAVQREKFFEILTYLGIK